MPNDKAVEIILPPNTLRAKLGSGNGAGLDPDAVKRAEQAMEKLKVEFSDWIAQDIVHLGETYAAFAAEGSPDQAGRLFRAAHDLKGQATTFEYPLVARVASSLAKLMDELSSREAAPLPLVTAHVEAINAIHRDGIKDVSNLTALTLVEELEAKVNVVLARASHTR